MTSLRALSVAIAATALLLVGASTATAAVTVGVTSDQGLRIAVSGGNATEVGVRPNSDGTKLEVTEQSAQMVLGSGCVQTDSTNPQRFRCNRPPLNFVTFAGGTARDKLFVAPGSGDCLCFGGAGNDELTSAEGADLVEGGSGADLIDAGAGGDVVRGGDGDDTLTGGPGTDREDGDAGNDVLRMGSLPDGNRDDLFGGAGRDEVDYGSRRAKVNVTLGETFDDGAPTIGFLTSEADNAHEDIEVITGGGGPDELAARFTVGATVSGGAGDDRLQGGSESDTLRGDTGSDAMFAGFGADTLLARDAIDDQVNQAIQCGSGSDVLDADVRDDDTRPLPTDCEQISQGMVGETRNVVIRYARRSRRGRLKIGLRCPRRTRNGCRGRLRVGVLRRTRGRLRVRFGRSAPYRIRRGRSRVVVARVRGRRTPRRGTRVRVYSRERGRLGPRTTFRTLRVRR